MGLGLVVGLLQLVDLRLAMELIAVHLHLDLHIPVHLHLLQVPLSQLATLLLLEVLLVQIIMIFRLVPGHLPVPLLFGRGAFVLLIILLMVHIVVWLRLLYQLCFCQCFLRVLLELLRVHEHLVQVSEVVPLVLRGHLAHFRDALLVVLPSLSPSFGVDHPNYVLEVVLHHFLDIRGIFWRILRIARELKYLVLLRKVLHLLGLSHRQLLHLLPQLLLIKFR